MPDHETPWKPQRDGSAAAHVGPRRVDYGPSGCSHQGSRLRKTTAPKSPEVCGSWRRAPPGLEPEPAWPGGRWPTRCQRPRLLQQDSKPTSTVQHASDRRSPAPRCQQRASVAIRGRRSVGRFGGYRPPGRTREGLVSEHGNSMPQCQHPLRLRSQCDRDTRN